MGDNIAAALLDGVAHSMAQVQKLPLPLLLLVPLHHAGLVGDAPGDDLAGVGGEGAVLKQGEQGFVREHAGLDGLGGPVGKHVGGQGLQAVRVTDHGGGLAEGPGQVLPGGQVHGGLPPHGGVHRRQQGGGQLDIPDAPEVHGGSKARHVPSDAAAQGGHAVRAGQMLRRQELQQLCQGGEILAPLPGGEDMGADGKARVLQSGGDGVQVQGGHGVVGQNGDPPLSQQRGQIVPAPAKQAAANAHIIGRPDPDGNGSDGVKHRKTPFIESCRAAAPEIGQLPPAVAFSSRPSFSKSCSR